MKAIFVLLILSFNILATEKHTTSDEPSVFLKEISKYAIKMGNGDEKVVYMFVDPMCKYSKKIIKKVHENKMLQLINTYYIFLYRLEKFESDKLIYYIYQSDDPKSTFLDVMVDEDIIELDGFEATKNTKRDMKIVSDMAKKIRYET